MRFGINAFAALAVTACCAAFAIPVTMAGDGVRNIKINEDRDQKWITTKVYELKNIKPEDITPWIQGAVARYSAASSCRAFNYEDGAKSWIVVTTGKDMMPYVDQMVATMDRPCEMQDGQRSIVDGSGIYRYAYHPKFRANDAMITEVLADIRTDGYGWYDSEANLFYWKDSKTGGDAVLQWIQAIDRPAPQAALSLNVYEVNENDFKELGLDWLAWKNGPGATLFGAGYDYTKWSTMADLSSTTLSSFGGFMLAPQFDSTYVKMLAEKGKARTATSASLTLVSDYVEDPGENNFAGAKYKLSFTPNYQYISSDADRCLSVDSDANSNIQMYFKRPAICFGEASDKMNVISFGWEMLIAQTVEQANTTGNNQTFNNQRFYSYTTVAAGTERLLATFVKDQKVTQNNGMPYLSDIPVLKYLTGSTSASISHSMVFVTLRVEPVLPKTNMAPWAGRIIKASEIPPFEK